MNTFKKWRGIGFSAFMCLLVAGCVDRAETVSKYDGVDNVREVEGLYHMYEIENGTVTCREHKRRSELACWRNGR